MVMAWVTDERVSAETSEQPLVPSIGLQKFHLSLPSAPSQLLIFPDHLSSSSLSWNFGSDLQGELALSLCFLWVPRRRRLWCDEEYGLGVRLT